MTYLARNTVKTTQQHNTVYSNTYFLHFTCNAMQWQVEEGLRDPDGLCWAQLLYSRILDSSLILKATA